MNVNDRIFAIAFVMKRSSTGVQGVGVVCNATLLGCEGRLLETRHIARAFWLCLERCRYLAM